ncbi:MAG: hypothetical protein IVW54_11200 [Candidatus Binataceae bacterium]|nr:hypothetical protein [Candidatus Binataceae bacterium]
MRSYKQMFPAAFAAFLVMIAAATAGAQSITISGQVTADGSGANSASVALFDAASPLTPWSSTVTADRKGNFTLSAQPPTTGTDVLYLVAIGAPGHRSASPIVFTSVIGTAAQLAAAATGGQLKVTVNELTTVGSAYALAQFATAAGSATAPIGVFSGATNGTTNASAVALNLYSMTSGADAIVPANVNNASATTTLNTIASIIASCAGSSGSTSGQCSNLFAAATPPGGNPPSNTFDAALDIARFPTAGSGLFALLPRRPDYTPVLLSAPVAWIAGINFLGDGFAGPLGIASDASGNLWAANNNSTTVTVLNPAGLPFSPSGYPVSLLVAGPEMIAIDTQGNAWVTDNADGRVIELCGAASSGCTLGSTLSTITGLTSPSGIAIDQRGNAWVADGSAVAEIASGTSTPVPYGTFSSADGIAIDANGNVWVTDNTGGSVTELCGANITSCPSNASTTGAVIGTVNSQTASSLAGATGIAIDRSGNAWVAATSNGAGAVTEITSAGAVVSGTNGFTGGGIDTPEEIAIDGAGNVWMANRGNSSVTELCGASPAPCPTGVTTGGAISPITGYSTANMNGAYGIAIDSSGNVWASNSLDGSVSELIGLASPVTTPVIGPSQPGV